MKGIQVVGHGDDGKLMTPITPSDIVQRLCDVAALQCQTQRTFNYLDDSRWTHIQEAYENEWFPSTEI